MPLFLGLLFFLQPRLALPRSYVSPTRKFRSHQLLVPVCAFGVMVWGYSTMKVMSHCQDDSLSNRFLPQGSCPLASPAYCPFLRLLCPPWFSESPSFPLFSCFGSSTILKIMGESLTSPKLPSLKRDVSDPPFHTHRTSHKRVNVNRSE